MKHLTMRRVGKTLQCFDRFSAEDFDAIKEGVDLRVVVTQKRSNPENNFFHAGIQLAWDNFDHEMRLKFSNPEKLKKAILIGLGFAEPLYRIDGSFSMEADSVAFDKMDQDRFNYVFNEAIVLCEDWLGYDPWAAWKRKKAMERGLS